MSEPRELFPVQPFDKDSGLRNFGPQSFAGDTPPKFMSEMDDEEEPDWSETPEPPTEVPDPKLLAFEP